MLTFREIPSSLRVSSAFGPAFGGDRDLYVGVIRTVRLNVSRFAFSRERKAFWLFGSSEETWGGNNQSDKSNVMWKETFFYSENESNSLRNEHLSDQRVTPRALSPHHPKWFRPTIIRLLAESKDSAETANTFMKIKHSIFETFSFRTLGFENSNNGGALAPHRSGNEANTRMWHLKLNIKFPSSSNVSHSALAEHYCVPSQLDTRFLMHF